jgi:hypothetical protein
LIVPNPSVITPDHSDLPDKAFWDSPLIKAALDLAWRDDGSK